MGNFCQKTIFVCVLGSFTFSVKSYAGAEVDDYIDINDTNQSTTGLTFNMGNLGPNIDWSIYNNWYGTGELSITNFMSPNLTIPFVLLPGAPAGSFLMDSAGRVGLGTTTPGGPSGSRLTVGTDSSNFASIFLKGTTQSYLLAAASNAFGVIDVNTLNVPFRIGATAPADSLVVATNGNVGVGSASPTAKLDVEDGNLRVAQSAAATSATIEFATATSSWQIKQDGNTGRLTFFSPGGGAATASFKFDRAAHENLLRVGVLAGDTVDINGKLVINGSQVTPDYVFGPDYRLESIEEHSELMWRNKHLPALPGAAADKSGVDIVSEQHGTLEELEKAHIYISQLNAAMKELQREVADLKEQQR